MRMRGGPAKIFVGVSAVAKFKFLKSIFAVCGRYLCLLFMRAAVKIKLLCHMRDSRQVIFNLIHQD